eukprot:149911-Rhodomonas_salina.1
MACLRCAGSGSNISTSERDSQSVRGRMESVSSAAAAHTWFLWGSRNGPKSVIDSGRCEMRSSEGYRSGTSPEGPAGAA